VTEPSSRRALAPQDLSGPAVLRWARQDRAAARGALQALDPAALAGLCQELRPEVRNEFFMLLEHPEEVVPLLAETEVAVTIRASGMSEAAWLLELATPEQRQACFDLDVWEGRAIDHARSAEWIDALIEAGRPVLAQALSDLDPELWVLALRRMADVVVVAREDERPDGFFTEDGVIYFRAHSDADFARVKEIVQCAFADAQPRYWQMVYGALFELPSEIEEFALRWRSGRLADLGFPAREQAMQAYRPLRPDQVAAESADATTWQGRAPSSLVERVDLPRQLDGTLVAEALAELPAARAADRLGYILGVANAVAVADGLRLSESESIPDALRKAVTGIDAGLRALARARDESPGKVLETTRPLDLFRIGATLEPERIPRPPPEPEPEDEPEGDSGES
jgi:hypothetical protein